ncbi:class F sortase [Streptomyces lycii]|nr:class F sortase [Streptomyces lycii]
MTHTTGPGSRRSRRRRVPLAVLAAVLTVLAAVGAGLALTMAEEPPSGRGSQAAPPAGPGDAGGTGAGGGGDGKALGASPPRRIAIPSLGVSSTLEELGLGEGGAMDTPRDPDKAGWYTPGPAPGAVGPAVIAGHVTWDGEPSVFHGLTAMRKGDRIEVEREDGRTAVFGVDRIARYPKADFPTLEVYGNVDHAALRLITCGGAYDESDNRYADNVVVYASLAGSRP